MYLKLTERLNPRKVAFALLPNLPAEEVDWDYENVYEWVYVDLPGLSFSLDVTRDHGLSKVDDDELNALTPDEEEDHPLAGPTYIYRWDRRTDSYVLELSDALIQRICDSVQSDILIYPGPININKADPKSIGRVTPNVAKRMQPTGHPPHHSMSYDFTIQPDETFSQFKPVAPLAAFFATQPHVRPNGLRDFLLKDDNRWMEIDIETVNEEGDNIEEEDGSTDPATFNCIRAHIPYGNLGKQPELDYLPLLESISQHLGWELIDNQMPQKGAEPKKPWWKFW